MDWTILKKRFAAFYIDKLQEEKRKELEHAKCLQPTGEHSVGSDGQGSSRPYLR
jgi:hypothetical protein